MSEAATASFSPEDVGAQFSFAVGEGKYAFDGSFTEGEYTGDIRGADGKKFAGYVRDLGGGRYHVEDWEGGSVFESPAEAESAAPETPEASETSDLPVQLEEVATVSAMDVPEPEMMAETGLTPELEMSPPPPVEEAEQVPEEPLEVSEAKPVALETEQALQIIQNARAEIQKVVDASRAGREIVPAEIDERGLDALDALDETTANELRTFDSVTKKSVFPLQRELNMINKIKRVTASAEARQALASGTSYEGRSNEQLDAIEQTYKDQLDALTKARQEEKSALLANRNAEKVALAASFGLQLDADGKPIVPEPSRQETTEQFSAERIAGFHEAIDEEAVVAGENLKRWEAYLGGGADQIAALGARDAGFDSQIQTLDEQMQDVLKRAKSVGKGKFVLGAKDQKQYDSFRDAQQKVKEEQEKLREEMALLKPLELQDATIVWGKVRLPDLKGEVTVGKKRRRIITAPRTEIGMMYENAVRQLMQAGRGEAIQEQVAPLPETTEPEPVPQPVPAEAEPEPEQLVEAVEETVTSLPAESEGAAEASATPEPELVAPIPDSDLGPGEIPVTPVQAEAPENFVAGFVSPTAEAQGGSGLPDWARDLGPVSDLNLPASEAIVENVLTIPTPQAAPLPEAAPDLPVAPEVAPVAEAPLAAPEATQTNLERATRNLLDEAQNVTGAKKERANRIGRATMELLTAISGEVARGDDGKTAAKETLEQNGVNLADTNRQQFVERSFFNLANAKGAVGADRKVTRESLEKAGLLELLGFLMELGFSTVDASLSAVVSEIASQTGAGR